MIVYVDADSCPVIKEIISISKNYKLKVILVKDYNHTFNINEENVDIVTIEQGNDSADLYILSKLSKNDILITNDMGLASIALSKNSYVLNFYGKEINNFNIDQLLFERHINKVNRRNNIYSSKFKKRVTNDNLNFKNNLIKLIKTATSK
ncbi:YaiI/YqxD family protein [Miniphocaeibacter massiliensis]|uniref:YaiI/YqxD family protein n=1 Tax=Miniphocaeibacter massiliensis TaxID=2041841 RepID=UPI000C1C0382|nr:DUF188 domain-containing protein [Miniphocaeibacter massiliensis]